MANYDNTRFYWLQLKEDFFDDDAICWLEEQPNGKEYSLFYLKLCLKSLRTNGIMIRKVGEILIPYDYKTLAKITNTNTDTVVVAMELLQKIGLIKKLETGEIYIAQVENMIGAQSVGAFKKQQQRIRQKNSLVITEGQKGDNCPLEKEKELELELEKEKEKPLPKNSASDIYKDEFDEVWSIYPNKKGKDKALKAYIKARKDGTTKEEIIKGLKAYINDIEVNKTPIQFIKHGATWFNQKAWQDDYNTQATAPIVGANGIKIDPNKTDLDDIF